MMAHQLGDGGLCVLCGRWPVVGDGGYCRPSMPVTGRLRCSEPSMQNLPIRTPEGARIRRLVSAQAEPSSYGGDPPEEPE
jgi:hypothetical protein